MGTKLPVSWQGAWWAIWPSRWLRRDKPVGLDRLGERLVLWRAADGTAQAALASCPHRQADLSLGRVASGVLECPYHGFRFAADGACVGMPCEGADAKIPPRLRLTRRTIVEENGFLWLRPGLPDGSAEPPVPWVPEAPKTDRGGAIREMTWPVPLARVVEGMLDIHHFPFAHRRFAIPRMTRVDPYTAFWDDQGMLRSQGVLRREDATSGIAFQFDLAFPAMLHLRLARRFDVVVVCAPIDDETTWISMRYTASIPVIGRVVSELFIALELALLQPDDRRMLVSSSPRHTVPEDGQLVRADKAIALWHARWRRTRGAPLPTVHDEARAPTPDPSGHAEAPPR